MFTEQFWRNSIRIVFLFAYGSFLWASIHHVAYFFADFEAFHLEGNGAYALAISIDVTSLVLTFAIMFFRRNMPRVPLIIVWIFIVALTAFSWTVNYEYARHFQSPDLTNDPTLQMLNPVLASSFAF